MKRTVLVKFGMVWNGVEEGEVSDKVDQLLSPPLLPAVLANRSMWSKGILR